LARVQDDFETDQLTPVVRVSLKRIGASDLVLNDELLRGCPLVRSLGERAAELVDTGTARRFDHQAHVFSEGEQGDSLYLVLKGEARLVRRRDQDTLEVGVARKGDVLGEAGLVEQQRMRAFSAIAQGQLDVLELSSELVRQRLPGAPGLIEHLRSIHRQRNKAMDELADFINRW
jgi:CRP-like cAMP-binding protein